MSSRKHEEEIEKELAKNLKRGADLLEFQQKTFEKIRKEICKEN